MAAKPTTVGAATLDRSARGRAVDLHVGMRLKLRRMQMQAECKAFADLLEISEEEYLGYENGDARLSPFILLKAAAVLEVPVMWFFDGSVISDLLQDESTESGRAVIGAMIEDLGERERRELFLSYFRVLSPAMQRNLIEIARSLAGSAEPIQPDTPDLT